MIALVALLTIAEFVLLAAVVLGAVGFVGLIVYDAIAGRKPEPSDPATQRALHPKTATA